VLAAVLCIELGDRAVFVGQHPGKADVPDLAVPEVEDGNVSGILVRY
jgi:hypothetical protein